MRSALPAIATMLLLLATACGSAAPALPDEAFSISDLLGGADTLHARAIERRPFAFPRDHGSHPRYRTEWWYFTGSLTSDGGRILGYQLTFFRTALTDSASFVVGDTSTATSAWRTRHAWMAHFAVTDAGASGEGAFHAAERFARGAAGLAGADASPFRVWLEDWSAGSLTAAATFPVRLRARARDIEIDLTLEQGKPIVLHGDSGLSRKGAEPGNASYYYSLTRMPTNGTVRTPAGMFQVRGTSWLDREWSTSVLSPGVAGWDWLSLQLDDGTELMLYRLRRHDSAIDPFSAGTFIDADDVSTALHAADFRMQPAGTWRAADGVEYPITWRVDIPSLDIALDVEAPVAAQELALAVRYWEGIVQARGTRAGADVAGRGYLEMTGYAGAPGPMR